MTVVASNYARAANDLYQTEPWATRALLRHIAIGTGDRVWEPAAGNHLMVDVLRETGAGVVTSDLVTYGRPHDFIFDFLNGDYSAGAPGGARFDAIVTNPPFGPQNRHAAKFARLALERCAGIIAMLCTAKFDFGKTRADLFADNPRFACKIALVDRIQWFPGDTEGTESHAWYVWAHAAGPRPGSPRLIYAGRDQ